MKWPPFNRASRPPANQPDRRDDIITVAYPGFMSSRSQIAKYTGGDDVVVLDHTGEKELFRSRCRIAARILHNVIPLPEVPELHYGYSWNPVHWLTMARSAAVGSFFQIQDHPTAHMHLGKVNLGGHLDQAQCRADIERGVAALLKANSEAATAGGKPAPQKKLVLFGCSRGAATVLQTALKLPEHLARHVALVIVEAPFDTLENVIHASSWFPRALLGLIHALGSPSDEDAYALPDKTALTCPVAFVTSRVDKRVPQHLSLRLVDAVRQRYPHIDVHHLELLRSHHSLMSVGPEDDRQRYLAFVNGLYDRYVSGVPAESVETEASREPIYA